MPTHTQQRADHLARLINDIGVAVKMKYGVKNRVLIPAMCAASFQKIRLQVTTPTIKITLSLLPGTR